MSIILKDPVTRQTILFCKGADSAILPRLIQNSGTEDGIILERTVQNLTMYAKQGLRTLVMSKRVITGEILKIFGVHAESHTVSISLVRFLGED